MVVQTRTDLTGVEPEKGQVLWKKPIKAFRGMNILTPTIFGNSVFTSSYGGKSLLFDLAKDSDGFSINQKWENKQEGYMSGPIVIGDYCYIHLRKQRMTCLDMKNGETKWISSEAFGKYMSMVSNGKEILALDEDGTLYLIEANPEKLVIKEKRTISQSPSWAHLAVAGNQLFVRELEAIACYEWAGASLEKAGVPAIYRDIEVFNMRKAADDKLVEAYDARLDAARSMAILARAKTMYADCGLSKQVADMILVEQCLQADVELRKVEGLFAQGLVHQAGEIIDGARRRPRPACRRPPCAC